MLKRFLQPFFAAWVLVTFAVTVLAVFPLIVVIGLRNSAPARKTIHAIISNWAHVWLWIIGMPVTVIGGKPSGRRHVIVANHISYLDTIALFPAVKTYFRPLGKKEMVHIPVIGFIYKQIVILVDRSSLVSRTRSMRLMWRILRTEADIIIFPEGTFNETAEVMKEFYDGAFRLAITAQTPLLPVIFPDTVDRWHYSGWWKLWPGRNRAICLPEVPVDGLTLEHLPALKEQVRTLMGQALLQYRRS
ncbi:MAG: lysophospholipid acyltransferase family protein [Bacteroidota bacterium]